ncbi:FAD-dependent oxidoreductase [Aquabacter spiritensis]|uniref:3-(3-hydroxy-phenyl)propionate hydroxylase n=1 Tax=Aquabacter spiritensis TaxID=933073 RepID=A0A4R3M204_9HYPH|nr:NAD(P)/FAD-dependent oxidoreductase [Aquabacter spiritensis]TCT06716.1 3-(3-hydroxy-phenyl)propionate hydroxylase [Aquabacter spiritensis]
MKSVERVIVAGCGPVGAVMALALIRKGIPVTIVEADAEPKMDQRAATVHPPTVEMLAELDLLDDAFETGLQSPIFHFRDRTTGELVAVFDVQVLEGEVAYPFVLQWEQYKLVRAVMKRLESHPLADMRFSTRLVDLGQSADKVEATVVNPAGETELLQARYIIGTDGGRSTVRRLADIEFEGFTWPERFIKIGTQFDFIGAGTGYCTRNYFSDPDEWLNLFKVKGEDEEGVWRGIFPVPADEPDEAALSAEGVQRRLQGLFPKAGDYDIAYHALYAVHQRVAKTFNKGRVLLAGDSAHVNNPIGGMGMNGGIHDAMNLADKLADVWFGRAEPDVFDRYTRQRRKAQVDFVQAQTILNKKSLEERDPALRREHLDRLRKTSEDLALHRKFLFRSSLFDSLREANEVL